MVLISLEFNISTKPLTPPPDELDFRVTNFYKFYDRKKQNTQKKKGRKTKTWYFSLLGGRTAGCLFFEKKNQEGLKLSDRCTYLNFQHSDKIETAIAPMV